MNFSNVIPETPFVAKPLSATSPSPLTHEQYTDSKAKKGLALLANPLIFWLRGLDLNQRPLGYEPL